MADSRRLLVGASFGAGLVFAVGLGVSGMTRPEKVLAFLDLGGAWDPSLLVVMATAIPVHALAWWFLAKRGPLLGTAPGRPAPIFDARLFGGAACFGVGWGLAGVCPGPAVVSLAAGPSAWAFVAALLVGVFASRWVAKRPALEETPANDGSAADGAPKD